MALVTIAEYAVLYPVDTDNTDESTPVQQCIDAADELIKKRVGRDIESATYTSKRINGSGYSLLYPPQWPITAVSSLTVNSIAWDVLLYSDTTDSSEEAFLPEHGYWLEARDNNVWPAGSGNILITYTAGLTTIPKDLKQACIMVAHLFFLERERLGQGARTTGPESVQEVIRNPKDYQLLDQVIRKYAFRP